MIHELFRRFLTNAIRGYKLISSRAGLCCFVDIARRFLSK